eukprot:827302-Pyramimonas_sp.AAC.1
MPEFGSTYFGEKSKSRIDRIIIPDGAAGAVRECRTLLVAGRRLQPIRHRERRDHIPVALVIDCNTDLRGQRWPTR